MRDLRHATGRSLHQVEVKHGINAVVLGSYERGDRNATLNRAEEILNAYGYTLKAVPIDEHAVRLPHDIVTELRLIADQIERRETNSIAGAELAADELRSQLRIDAGIEWGKQG